jgi:hypothetical protein
MRTTLDIDDDVLQAAKEFARAEGKTAGKVVSDYARKGMSGTPGTETRRMVLKDGFYVLTGRRGVVVTKEQVDRLIEEADLADASIVKE